MSKKNHPPGPVPAGNKPHAGTVLPQDDNEQPNAVDQYGTGFQEEDPKRRLGDFTGTGEHSRQQPGPKNDGGKKHGEGAG